jgi:hypothetical protein
MDSYSPYEVSVFLFYQMNNNHVFSKRMFSRVVHFLYTEEIKVDRDVLSLYDGISNDDNMFTWKHKMKLKPMHDLPSDFVYTHLGHKIVCKIGEKISISSNHFPALLFYRDLLKENVYERNAKYNPKFQDEVIHLIDEIVELIREEGEIKKQSGFIDVKRHLDKIPRVLTKYYKLYEKSINK